MYGGNFMANESETTIQGRCLRLLETWEGKGKPVTAARTNAGMVRVIELKTVIRILKMCVSIKDAVSILKRESRYIHLAPEGWPDITACIKGGRFVGFEVKTPDGVQSPGQVKKQAKIEEIGGIYVQIRGEKELNAYLKSELGDI